MKKLGLVFVFLICFSAVHGFCGGSKDRYVTFTDDLITFVNDSGENIYDLKYYLSSPLKTTGDIEIIKDSDKGKLVVYTPGVKKSLEVVFFDKYKLEFQYDTQNPQNNTFNFASAIDITTKQPVTVTTDPKPHLRVYYKSNDYLNLSAVPTYSTGARGGGTGPLTIDDQFTEELTKARTEAGNLTTEIQKAKNEAGPLTEELKDARRELKDTIDEFTPLTGQLLTSVQNAKTEADQLIEALRIVRGGGGGAPIPTPANSLTQTVPLTRELVNAINTVKPIGQRLRDLTFYLSIPLTLTLNSPEEDEYYIKDGIFVVSVGNNTSSDPINILPVDKGNLVDHISTGKEKFEISFPDKTTAILTFERNEQKNSYDFAFASNQGKKYYLNTTRDMPLPQLYIHYNYSNNQSAVITAQSVPAIQPTEPEQRTTDPQRDVTQSVFFNTQVQQSPPRVTVPAPVLTPVNTSSRNIIGVGTLTTDGVAAYIKRNNPNARNVEALINAYITEAKRETINWDIAIAQMCHATDYLRNQQLINTRNYAGFGAINGVPVRYDAVVPGVDRGVDIGVRAHIQHLKGYATKDEPKGILVDKRYKMIGTLLGTAPTLDRLYRIWAPNNPDYGNKINSILTGLYQFSGR